MTATPRIHSRIAGTGSALPTRVVTNDELAKTVGWLRPRWSRMS